MFDTSLQDLRPPILVIFFKFFIYLIIVISDFTVERSNYGGTGGQKRQTPVPPKNMSRIIFPLNSWLLLLDCWKVLIIFQINVQRIYLLPTTNYSACWGERTKAPGPSPTLDCLSILISIIDIQLHLMIFFTAYLVESLELLIIFDDPIFMYLWPQSRPVQYSPLPLVMIHWTRSQHCWPPRVSLHLWPHHVTLLQRI